MAEHDVASMKDLVHCVRLLSGGQRPIVETESRFGYEVLHTARMPAGYGHHCASSHTSQHAALAKLVSLLASWPASQLREPQNNLCTCGHPWRMHSMHVSSTYAVRECARCSCRVDAEGKP